MSIKKREDCFIGMHFDFHAGDDCTEIGKSTDEEMIQYIIDTVHPDFLQCDCKGHRGLSSYPTNVGNPAPGFVKDNLRIWRDVTKKNGIPLYMHYSGIWDTEALAHHPEWAAKHADGTPDATKTTPYGPYVDELFIPQIKELITDYEIDGIWVDGDCWAMIPDYGDKSAAAFKAETGLDKLPEGPEDEGWSEFKDHTRRSFVNYVKHYESELHKFDPTFQLTSNWAYSSQMPGEPEIDLDFLSGDSALLDSFDENRFEGRMISAQGKPWDLMSWAFSTVQSEGACSMKPPAQLEQEAAAVLSMGGAFQAYYNQKRDGSIYKWQMKTMGKVADFCRERKEWCWKSKPIPQVALFSSTEDFYKKNKGLFGSWTLWGGPMVNVKGTMMNLLDNQFSVEILAEHQLKKNIDKYPVVVVPELRYLCDATKKMLLDYVAAGGSLLLIGGASVELFEKEAGVKLLQHATPEMEEAVRNSIAAPGSWQENTKGMDFHYINFVEYDGIAGGFSTVGVEAEALPGTEIVAKNFGSIDEVEGAPWFPAATVASYGKGKIGTILLNIGERYLNGKTYQGRKLLGGMMDKLFKPAVKVTGSHHVDVIYSSKNGKKLVQLVNSNGHGNPKEYTFDEIVPVPALNISVKLDKEPASVTVQPGNRVPVWSYENGELNIKLGGVELYDIIVID